MSRTNFFLALVLAATCLVATAERLCFVEWSISNSYTIASQGSSYVTLNLYASTGNGTEDIVAPYNLTILNPAYVDAFSWNFEVLNVTGGVILGQTEPDQGFWQTLLAGNKNVFNLGGNIETTVLGAPPLLITIDGIVCTLQESGTDNITTTSSAGSPPPPTPTSTSTPTSSPPPPAGTIPGTIIPGTTIPATTLSTPPPPTPAGGTTGGTTTTIIGNSTTTVVPGNSTTTFVPGSNNTNFVPGTNTTIYTPGTNTIIQGGNTTTIVNGPDTTTIIPGQNTTTVIPGSNITIVLNGTGGPGPAPAPAPITSSTLPFLDNLV